MTALPSVNDESRWVPILVVVVGETIIILQPLREPEGIRYSDTLYSVCDQI